jgi:hypothetical protein
MSVQGLSVHVKNLNGNSQEPGKPRLALLLDSSIHARLHLGAPTIISHLSSNIHTLQTVQFSKEQVSAINYYPSLAKFGK